jgi:glycosyltransferase involved in cell wall biosynthesis
MMSKILNKNEQSDVSIAKGKGTFQMNDGSRLEPEPSVMSRSPAPSVTPELQRVRTELTRIVDTSSTIRAAQEALDEAEALASDHAEDPTVRFILLQLMELAGQNTGITERWADLLRVSPEDIRIVRFYARRLVKERRREEALQLVDHHLPETLDDPRVSLARAEFLADVRAHEESDALFRRLVELHDRRELRVAFAKRLRKRGFLAEAVEILAPVVERLAPDSKAAQLAATLIDDYEFYRRFEPEDGLAGQDIKVIAMKHAILHFQNRVSARRPADQLRSVALVTGNLGAGGAERQLSRLACNLQRLRIAKGNGEGKTHPIPAAVEVLVKQHSGAFASARGQRLDFFLGDLLDAEVSVKEISKLPAVSTANQKVEDPDLLRLLEQLPPQVHYGVTRLCPYLRERDFDVVSLWQDGTCLFGALAALLAGTPVIHLVFRGLPPNIRRDRYRPEYSVLYQAMAEIPGVHFVSNSKAAAKEYAQWLGLPLERFHILYNGVPELDTAGSAQDKNKWNEFAARTQGATETIGGVFRLEPDKRPLLWIKLAHRYLKRRPDARFLIVGHGRLHDETISLAVELGVANRLLLAGHSVHVGFWYSKMDVKVLLSSFEGLPNVLIEAQLLGVRTVSTPAGGAAECFIDGVTGHLLKSVEKPDLDEACDRIAVLANTAGIDQATLEMGRLRALTLFSVDAMIEAFMALCTLATPVSANEDPANLLAIEEAA